MMDPADLRALADTVAWQDRTDLHGAMLGAADEIERLRDELADARVTILYLLRQRCESIRRSAERSRAVREDLDPSPRSVWRAPEPGDDGRTIEEGGCW